MGAKKNFVVAVSRGASTFSQLLLALEPFVEELIGDLRIVSILNFETGEFADRPLDLPACESVPDFMQHEIVFFYSKDMSTGSVSLVHEGSFVVMTISVDRPALVLDLLPRMWKRVGEYSIALLVGDECEVEESELVQLIESGELPESLDLCDAAVIKAPGASDLEWGARLVVTR